ncbi:putative N-acetylglucosaminyl-phosphatidylinositol de-N-acetylase [Apostichopus japonicus]|uniref:N-acetylglucosaminylphosphatidylinositol deacetylase n=1 Tax=Stichopus japonicus TaxID=307972 RepID=A0A2G8KMP1_STIJA|nr:putative N-acetylglucosaminyl-phosphatidylinositol de-N-acetylase [Apostichopus japonicus]
MPAGNIYALAALECDELGVRRAAYLHPKLVVRRKKSKLNGAKHKKNFVPHQINILFVIAHPDDECMFFGPSLLNAGYNKANCRVSLLCLSEGNFYGEGDRRRKELFQSCEVFGIHWKDVKIVDHCDLQDNPAAFWDVNLVAKEILKVVKNKKINQIITFDCFGASGHKNHISVYRGARHLVVGHHLPKGMRVSSLETVSLFRHYITFLDLPFSLMSAALRGSRVILSSPMEVWTAQRAMKAHWSQFVWFRVLNILFSRYLVVNTLRPINKNSPT